MYRLDEERFAKAKPILEKYRAKLHATGKFNPEAIEKELRQCWHATSRDVKDVVMRLSKTARYKYLAAYYMEHSDAGKKPLMEFWPTLSVVYGVEYYQSLIRVRRQKAFWRKFKTR
jgi:hypothetical protein